MVFACFHFITKAHKMYINTQRGIKMSESDKFKRVPVLIPWEIYNEFLPIVKKKTGKDKISPYIVTLIVEAIEKSKKE
jgi:hypothetical protein